MAIAAQFINMPFSPNVAQISTANTARDGTGTLGTVATAGRSGARIDRLRIQATGTTTAGMIRLFVANADSSAIRLIDEISVGAVTPSATVPALVIDRASGAFPLILPPNFSLRAGTNNAETFNVMVVEGGDF